MSAPLNIREYLTALNAGLELALRNRRRLLEEVADHLSEATESELRKGASHQQAQRRAIAAFGPPEEVAASFESGLLGGLDRRVALAAGRLDVWLGQHPWGGAVPRLALALLGAAAIAAVGAAGGAKAPLMGAYSFLAGGTLCWVLYRCAQARALRARPEPGLRARLRAGGPGLRWWLRDEPASVTSFFLAWALLSAYLGALEGDASAVPTEWVWSYVAASQLALLLEYWASRGDEGKETAWRTERPWSAALVRVAPAPLALLPLLLSSSAPLGGRLALWVMSVGVAAVVVVGMRLGRSEDEREALERRLLRRPSGGPSSTA